MTVDHRAARITLLPSREKAARLAASLVGAAIAQGLAARGRASVALGGGASNAALHALSRQDLDWSRVVITLTDERWVDPCSPASRQRQVEEALLAGPARRACFRPMKSDTVSPLAGIGRYLRALSDAHLPLDAVLLGLGDDGHFAFLFPRSKALREGLDMDVASRCVAVPAGAGGDEPAVPRLSLTLSTIAKARRVVLTASGATQLNLLRKALAWPCNPIDLPVAALLAARPDIVIPHCPD